MQIRDDIQLHCGLGEKINITVIHCETVIKHINILMALVMKQLADGGDNGQLVRNVSQKYEEGLLKYLKSIVRDMTRVVFYPTTYATNKVKSNMHKAGVDHKYELLKAVNHMLYTKWLKKIDTIWMKPEK
eukprot:8736504-Ditylum_brightwellii.AAC.1